MVQELVFHLGDCKTGTTALQSVLAGGLARAHDGRDYLYPARFNHIPLAKTISGLKGEAAEAAHRDRRWSALAREMEKSDARWGIVSAEHFEFVPPGKLKAALDDFLPGWEGRSRFIAYVRPHPERIVSAYAEAIKKTGIKAPMARFLRAREGGGGDGGLYHFHPRFTAWRAVFGDAFTLRPFIRSRLAQGDIVADFLDWLGGPGSFAFSPGPLDNSALDLADLALMRMLHDRLEQGGGDLGKARLQFGWNLAPFLNARKDGQKGAGKLRMDAALCAHVAGLYREDARALDRDFFGTGDGAAGPMEQALDDARRNAVPAPQSLEAADYFSPGELALARAFADFTGRVMAAEPAHFMWASKPADERRPVFERGPEGGRRAAAKQKLRKALNRFLPLEE